MLNKNGWRYLIRCIGLIAFVLLSACSTIKKDGPPPYNVDVSKIPNAVPKVEKLSKYGNRPVYTVFGKDYYVRRSSKNFEERGVASWYGTKFHSRHTSSGERYDMLAMTAAHRTLPLPTYVEVTNLSNRKKIIVKINVRGPFADNRIIDLSYAAAKKLGMLGRGTALVDIKAIDPLKYDKNSTSSTHSWFAKNTPPRHYGVHHVDFNDHRTKPSVYLQVGAFRNKAYAEKLKQRLLPHVSSPIQITQLSHSHKLYRVQIGPIQNAETATRLHKRLKLMGLNSKQYELES